MTRASGVSKVTGSRLIPMADTRSPEVRAALKLVPASVRLALESQCGGDWRRVTLDASGSFVVHNQPQKRVIVLPDARPRKKAAPRKKQPVADAPVLVTPTPERVVPAETIHPGVNVVRSRDKRPTPLAVPRKEVAGTFDWSSVDLDVTAIHWAERFKDGLPEAIGFGYYDEVEALVGLDKELVRNCLAHPQRVVVAPETKHKGFPVLRFHRGDVTVAIGLREPTRPLVIAAYWHSLLQHDTHHVNHTGGGGSKAQGGLPKTSRLLVRALRNHGADIEMPDGGGHTAEVRYQGQCLGQITIGDTVPRETVENDWQRMQRKIHAIDQRQPVG